MKIKNMKIEKLNENKIRVTLNLDDLIERNIDYHSFMSNSIESQSIFLDMLNRAEKEVGFNTDDCRIMIEAIALKDGRFIFTITKYSRDEINDNSQKFNPSKKMSLHIKRKTNTPENSKAIYCFDTFEAFCNFCEFIKNSTYKDIILDISENSKLHEYNSNYYLTLSNIDLNSKASIFVFNAITEFSHFISNPELYERKIAEYGKVIMDNNAIITCTENFV